MDPILLLRAITIRLRRIPGAVFALEPFRRMFSRTPRSRVVADFDGGLLEVRLDEHMGSHIFWYGSYSREVLEVIARLLRPGMTVLDIGANLGEVAIFSGKRVLPAGKVLCFEPMQALADVLRRNIARNGLQGIQVIQSGVADYVGSAPFFSSEDRFHDGTLHAGLGTIYGQEDRSAPSGQIPLTTVDHFAIEAGLSAVDLIKIDVEGAELPVLRGALNVLLSHHPWLVIEVQRETSAAGGYDQADILELLGGLGYTFARIGRRGRLSTLTVATLADFQNVLAVPPGQSVPHR